MVTARAQSRDIALELRAQYPHFEEITVGEGVVSGKHPTTAEAQTSMGGELPTVSEMSVLIVSAQSTLVLDQADRKRIENWLRVRAKSPDVLLIVELLPKVAELKDPANSGG